MNPNTVNMNTMNNVQQGVVPTSSNSIYGPADPAAYVTPTYYEQPTHPIPAAPPNPADLVQIPLRLTASKKKSSIARFHTPHNQPIDFNTMAHPVKMYRAPEVSEPEPAPPPKENPFFKKKSQYTEKKPVQKDAKAVSLFNNTQHSTLNTPFLPNALLSHTPLLFSKSSLLYTLLTPLAPTLNHYSTLKQRTFNRNLTTQHNMLRGALVCGGIWCNFKL